MRLEIQGDNVDERAETAHRAVGMIFGPNTASGPVRMAPNALRLLLTKDWPMEVLEAKLRAPGDTQGRVFPITMTRLEVYHDRRYAGAAMQMSYDSLRQLVLWENACAES